MEIPFEVMKAVHGVLTQKALQEFWNQAHPLLNNQSPRECWEAGKKKEVLAFIDSAKSGDMA